MTYRYDRGEPRGALHKGQGFEDRGDCIDCKQCVQVCPMGIDIRDGAQLECIHCALCIDACDDIMKRVDRPTGLIAYDTDLAVAIRAAGGTPKYKLLRARTILYAVLMLAISALILVGLAEKPTFQVSVLKDRSPPFVQLADGSVRNGYTLKLVNKATTARNTEISISGLDGVQFQIIGLEKPETGSEVQLPLEQYGVDRFRMLVTAPPAERPHRTSLVITVRDPETGETHTSTAAFVTAGAK